jgi:ATP/maltotriose-dependent transcriptional regulator MalT
MGEPPASGAPEGAAAGLDVLLATKLHVPRARYGLVSRSRLVDRLTEALAARLTLVSAPAGFGKTALLADWARRGVRPVAWLSLDTADNDPVRFWRYVAAAVGNVRAGAGQRLAPLFGSWPLSPEAAVTALVNELAAAQGNLVLVLDDYHLIESSAVHESVVFLLEHLPAGLRLAVACRADPPLPLPRLRARGELAELRAAELRFTQEEAAELLREAAGAAVSADVVAALEARTEGWAAGLQLAALSLRGQEDAASFVAGFSGSHRYVLDYLAEEVLDRQPETVRTFLLETSVLDRLSGELCDAVTGRPGSQQLLETIERAGLFLSALDEVRGWWRYHPLFADLLRARLGQERPLRQPGLHRAAAAWCEQRGLADDAVRHALAAGDPARAARLVERYIGATLAWGEGATVTRWLASLPGEQIRARPRLCALRAIQAVMGGQAGELERWLDAAEAALASAPSDETAGERAAVDREAGWLPADVPGTLMALRTDLARLRGDADGTIRLARQALARLPAAEGRLRLNAEWNLARAFWLNGDLGEAEQALAKLAAAAQPADENLTMHVCWERGLVMRAQGRLGTALASYRQALATAAQAEGPALPAAGMAHLGVAAVLYEQDELAGALEHVTEGLMGCRQLATGWSVASGRQLAEGLVILARVQLALGDQTAATAAIREAGEAGPSSGVVDLFNPAGAERVRLLLAQGQLTKAADWVAGRGLDPGDQPSYPREREYLLLARVLIAQGEPGRALPLLERLHTAAAAQRRTGSLVEIGAVTARTRTACGQDEGAAAALAEALALAWPEGHVRVFADEGASLAAVLGRLIAGQRGERASLDPRLPVTYLRRIQSAFRRAGARLAPPQATPAAVAAPGLTEPLTDRELQVLALLAAGASNQQIASELVVALETVKKHVSHILGKLAAANRTQAVARARELGLLR